MTLADAIPVGFHNAQTKDRIAASLGWPVREFEQAVETARKAGQLAICSSGRGYWQPLHPDEYARNVDGRRRRALNQLLTNRGERRLLARWRASTGAQGVLWEAA